MNKLISSTMAMALAMFAMLAVAVPATAQQNEVYFVPQSSSAPYCNTTEVQIWVNATNFQSGAINLIYDPVCANVTNFVRNTANFPLGGWDSSNEGKERITFIALAPLTGEYLIGNLTIHCVSEEECRTTLDFVEPSALFDPYGNELSTNWVDGTFMCEPVTHDVFDTGQGTYPSIFGTHNGTIKSNHTITISKLYTYPCPGTGGHSEYTKIYNDSWSIETLPWEGYKGDWHNLSFKESFKLYAGVEYNYTIITGSYPQIHHNKTLTMPDGEITCTKFIDANGRVYYDWIPAIRLGV